MPKPRGRTHTTLTETASEVVRVLRHHPAVKMIAPGEISNTGHRSGNKKFITIIYTTAGLKLIISGQGSQLIAVHTDSDSKQLADYLITHKRLSSFIFKERTHKPR